MQLERKRDIAGLQAEHARAMEEEQEQHENEIKELQSVITDEIASDIMTKVSRCCATHSVMSVSTALK